MRIYSICFLTVFLILCVLTLIQTYTLDIRCKNEDIYQLHFFKINITIGIIILLSLLLKFLY